MIIIITDTNVFIDIIQSGMLEAFFQLPYKICTTDLVVEEIKQVEQRQAINKYQNENRLTVLELDATEIMNAWNMPTEWALKRITDRSVLLKAVQLKCMVLSGDVNLRKECIRHGLTVHGSIWVIREIWLAGISESQNLMAMLDELQKNTWLPAEEIQKLRREIGGEIA